MFCLKLVLNRRIYKSLLILYLKVKKNYFLKSNLMTINHQWSKVDNIYWFSKSFVEFKKMIN